jgi:hypothetical protein
MDGQMWNRVMNKLVAGLSAKTGPRAVIVSKMTFKPSFRLVRNLSEEGLRTSRSDKRNIFISLCEPRLMKIPASLKRESMIRQPHHAVTLDLSQSECPTATLGLTKKVYSLLLASFILGEFPDSFGTLFHYGSPFLQQ